jgi:hypothetical protein
MQRRPLRGRCFTQPKDAIHRSIDTAPPNIFALHKFTPQRPQSAPIFTSQPAKLEIFQRHKVGTGFARQAPLGLGLMGEVYPQPEGAH